MGHGVGQDKQRVSPSSASTKSKPEIYPQYPFLYAELSEVSSQGDLYKHNKSLAYFMQDFVNGGGEWIRTAEVVDNRFTVCPLWPLGNSPINVFNFWCRQPAGISANDFHAVRARLARGGTPLELVNGLEPLTC